MERCILILSVALISVAVAMPTVQDLGSSACKWAVRSANGSITIPATVPGEIQRDLMAAGIIGDLSFGLNEQLQRWIASDNFTFTTKFNVTSDVWLRRNIDLTFDGLDTAALVLLNNVDLLRAANMHRRFRVSLKHDGAAPATLQQTNNTLTVTFTGPVPFSAEQLAACNAQYCPAPWSGPAPDPIVNNAYIRKEQASFSWDFAPAVGQCGIWAPVQLVGYDTAVLTDLIVSTSPTASGDSWSACLTARAWSSGTLTPSDNVQLSVQLRDPSNSTVVTSNVSTLQVSVSSAFFSGAICVTVSSPALWWPRGYGAPTLYFATLQLNASGEVSTLRKRVGFRTVELAQPEVPGGTQFYYVINGVPIFTRGSNWVPADYLNTRLDVAYVYELVRAAADANMNMLRVWGGGVYPSAALLDAADDTGVMITVDAQFGDQFYCVDSAFLANVAAEVADNVWRIASHACIVQWTGNNEMGSGYADAHHLYADAAYYSQLYFGTVLANVTAVDTSRIVLSTTPCAGNETAAQPFHPHMSSPWKGDMHFYMSFADLWNPMLYPRARFVTESGQESWPSFLGLVNVTTPADWAFNGTVMVARQHHPPGQAAITDMVQRHWLWPNVTRTSALWRADRTSGRAAEAAMSYRAVAAPRTVDVAPRLDALDAAERAAAMPPNATLLADQLWATQIAAAAAMRAAVHHWRRVASEFNASTPGGTRGVLYWQLNDMWAAPSWASLEPNARWKALHHAAVRFFAPVLVSPFAVGITDASAWNSATGVAPNANDIVVSVYVSVVTPHLAVDDAPAALAALRFTLWSYATGAVAAWSTAPVVLPTAPNALSVWNASLASVVARAPGSACDDLRACMLTVALADNATGATLSDEWLFLSPPSLITTLTDPGLTVADVQFSSIDAFGRQTLLVTLVAARLPAVAVWLESALGGHFSDNAFVMTTGVVNVTWTQHPSRPGPVAPGGVTPAVLAASISVWSLFDVDARYGG